MSERSYSVVVPVYKSSTSLIELHQRLTKVFEDTIKEPFELILVDDGSPNIETWQRLTELHDKDPRVKIIQLMKNYGQHNALLAGIRQAQHEIIVTIDDDLQHPPEEIPRLLEKLNEGFDVVYGTPETEQHGFWRDLASQITKIALSSVMNVEVARKTGAFRVFRAYLRNSFADYRGTHPSIDVLLTWGTNRFASISVKHELRDHGVSNYTFGKLVNHAINMATGFSTLPLRIASLLGFSFTVFGFCILVYVVVRYMVSSTPVAGFPFLASIIAIFSGVQLFAIGVIGKYLARMHLRLMDRPSYVILEKKNPESCRLKQQSSNESNSNN